MAQQKRTFNYSFFSFLLLFFLSFVSHSQVSIRTSVDKDHIISCDKLFVAIDFEVPLGEHVTAPIGKGKSLSPNIGWKNAKTLNIIWPESENLPDSNGEKSEYFGYKKNFTLLCKISIEDQLKPIEYDLLYVLCGNSCRPIQESGKISPNGLLSQDEIEKSKCISKNINTPQFLLMVLFGILGGIILNCMPCVFPIILMKIFGIMKSSDSGKESVKKHGLISSLGTILTFVSLGSILLLLRSTTSDIGWGFLMQEPRYIVCLLISFLLCALHFFGIYNMQLPGIRNVKFPINSAYIKSFFSGIFGALISAACVGPFAGIAIASSLLYGSVIQSECIFMGLGIGVASPFLIMAFFPGVIKFLPKPGEWMERFKEFMGFAMLFSCVWALWILTSQIDVALVMEVLLSVVMFAMFLWMFGKSKSSKVYLVISVIGAFLSGYSAISLAKNIDNQNSIVWKDYSDQIFENSSPKKRPMFLDFTASWCLNCQFNKIALNDKEVVEAFKNKEIETIKCDWTHKDETITKLLKKFGAVSVPFYVFYPKDGSDPIILPTILTVKKVLDVVNSGVK